MIICVVVQNQREMLHLIPNNYDEYIYASNPYGGLGLALATKFGSKVIVFVNENFLGPLARMAFELGARYYYVPSDIYGDARNYALSYASNDNKRYFVENGMDIPGVKTNIL